MEYYNKWWPRLDLLRKDGQGRMYVLRKWVWVGESKFEEEEEEEMVMGKYIDTKSTHPYHAAPGTRLVSVFPWVI